jgi:toxin ParE1/3/4
VSEKPVVPREQASRDIEAAALYCAHEAGAPAALRFIDEVESAFRAIARNPAAGSPRYAYELNLPGLRIRMLKRHPYLVFYVEEDDHIDVWRVLHARRDVAAWMEGSEGV